MDEALDVVVACADAEQGDAFSSWATTLFPVLSAFAAECGVDDLHTKLVLTDDFAGYVATHLGAAPGETFSTERLGGTAVAKTLVVPDDPEGSVIVFDAAVLGFDAPGATATSAFFIVHELGHALFRVLRRRSGALAGVHVPAETPQELARGIVGEAVEELRCDLLASSALQVGNWFRVSDGSGEDRSWRLPDSTGAVYRAQVATVLDEHVFPGWPDAVWAYRTHELTLDDMWFRVASGTNQLLTLLGHAEAEASMLEMPGPLVADCAEHPATTRYVGPVWAAIMEAQRGQPWVPSVGEFADLEWALLDVGEAAVFELWRKLGLRPRLEPGGNLFIQVDDPEW